MVYRFFLIVRFLSFILGGVIFIIRFFVLRDVNSFVIGFVFVFLDLVDVDEI